MAMDRLRRVSNVWNWLPAFRVVAEYESIHKAAAVLNVSASALSRTVKLLEDAIGELLFVRSASGLTLTTFGSELLLGTRDAMRRIDDVIAAPADAGMLRAFVAGADGSVLPRLLDWALAGVISDFPDVTYRTTSVDEEDVATELLRGNLDFALVEAAADLDRAGEISYSPVGDLEFAIYAPPDHPLAATGEPLSPDVVDAARLVTLAGLGPRERGTSAGVVVGIAASLESAERLASRGSLLAVLPVAMAPPEFHRVAPSATRMSVLAVYRRPREPEAPALVRALVRALGATAASAVSGASAASATGR